jgi:hypothetical protein
MTGRETYIHSLEQMKELDPDCKMCQEIYYPKLQAGQLISDIFAPRHKASDRCKSGKYSHCTCDTCF